MPNIPLEVRRKSRWSRDYSHKFLLTAGLLPLIISVGIVAAYLAYKAESESNLAAYRAAGCVYPNGSPSCTPATMKVLTVKLAGGRRFSWHTKLQLQSQANRTQMVELTHFSRDHRIRLGDTAWVLVWQGIIVRAYINGISYETTKCPEYETPSSRDTAWLVGELSVLFTFIACYGYAASRNTQS